MVLGENWWKPNWPTRSLTKPKDLGVSVLDANIHIDNDTLIFQFKIMNKWANNIQINIPQSKVDKHFDMEFVNMKIPGHSDEEKCDT